MKINNVLFSLTLIVSIWILTSCNNFKNKNMKQDMNYSIFEKGEQLSNDIITGKSWHKKLVDEDSVFTTAVGNEEFEAGSRNIWHSHPGGQILIVTSGVGYHQIKGEPIQIIRKGDIVKCPPNVIHWHGASKDSSVSQIYIIPNTENGIVNWHEKVTDEEYNSVN